MNTRTLPSSVAFLAAILFAIPIPHVAAQEESEIQVKKIDVEFERPPGRDRGKGKFKNAEWMIISAEYDVEPFDRDIEWIDDIEFRVMIEGRDMQDPNYAEDEGAPVLLTGSVAYSIVPEDKGLICKFYIHPMVVERFGGERVFKTKRTNTRVEVYQGSRLIAEFNQTEEDDVQWFARLKKVDGMVVSHDESPFRVEDVSSTPPIKSGDRR